MIAIPIVSSSTKGALKDIEKAKDADLIEIRLDYIRDLNEKNLRKLFRKNKTKIVTNRKRSEGGRFLGTENQRIDILKKAIALGTDYIDIELSCGSYVINDIKKIAKKNKAKLIISYHNFKKTSKAEVFSVYEKIKKLNPNIIKIVTYANSINDNKIIMDIIKKSKHQKRKIIAMCMGEKSEISRILGPILGTEITFGSLSDGKRSALGQISARLLNDIYRINSLKNKKVKIFGLVGNPVRQSKGIFVHNESFKKLNLNNIYVNFPVDDLKSFIINFQDMFSGLSITIPYKTDIMKYLDKIDPMAKKIGAVNTVVKKGNTLIGYNTDWSGAMQAINKKNIHNKKVVIIGAGGAARAIAFGIKKYGGDLIIVNGTRSKGKKLAMELNCEHSSMENANLIENASILINSTSIGMYPKTRRSPFSKNTLKSILDLKSIVFDTVYNPIETQLLKDAKVLGHKQISGVDMFINQAAEQFELWTKRKAPLQTIRRIAYN